jgi:hypothetical protein
VKSTYYFHYVHQPSHLCIYCSCHRMNFHAVWWWGLLVKYVEEAQICLKSDKTIGQFTWIQKYVLLLPATLNPNKSAWSEWNGIRLLG